VFVGATVLSVLSSLYSMLYQIKKHGSTQVGLKQTIVNLGGVEAEALAEAPVKFGNVEKNIGNCGGNKRTCINVTI
jgi:hypothetical protein